MNPDTDDRWMRRAIQLARRGPSPHPNPRVGAVLVRDGVLLAEGRHRGVGSPHAEADALSQVHGRAAGATMVVTLEPCVHLRRPDGSDRIPCTRRCIDAGIVRVVAAMEDPDPLVSGGGFAALRAAGIRVDTGTGADVVSEMLAGYMKHRTLGLPLVIHKAASTLDGKIAAVGGDSRWVTGPEARRAVHRLRARVDAIVVGVGTVLADDPALDVRLPGHRGAGPLRVVCDSRLRLPLDARMARPGTLVATLESMERSELAFRLADRGVEVRGYPAGPDGRVDPTALARDLARRGCCEVLLEAGGTLAASFHSARLVDRAWFHFAPKLVGGASAPTPIDGDGLTDRMAEAVRLTKVRVRRYGGDIAVEGWIDAGPNRDRPDPAAGAA